MDLHQTTACFMTSRRRLKSNTKIWVTMNKLGTIYGSGSQMEVLSILQFKLVRSPAEEFCLVLIFAENNQSRTVRAIQCLRIRARLCHPSPSIQIVLNR